MKITKIETNIKRNMFLQENTNRGLSPLPSDLEKDIIHIDDNFVFQEIVGFGGAITESAGYALSTVDKKIADNILDDYFGNDGLRYNICRLPIGSCDFSISSYSYSYEDDLSDFQIDKDMKYIIPTIHEAQKRNPHLTFLSSPWSPPAFMKDNKKLSNGGKLLSKYRQLWAQYLVKYVQAYQNQNIPISYMTIQNEPNAVQSWESCVYNGFEEADLLKNYLVPTFKKNRIDMKFLIWDHNKDAVLDRSLEILIENNAIDYADGIAFHWYMGNHFESLALLSQLFPDKLLVHTEGCTGYSNFKPKDELFNAEMYAYEILEDLNHGVNSFIDWNIVLDYQGGPNHVHNYCNSPIMINKTKDGYIKTPSFYYIAHFSKYIKPGAKRIHVNRFSDNICVAAFQNPDKSVIIILLNKQDKSKEYNLCYKHHFLHDNLDGHCIVTYVIK